MDSQVTKPRIDGVALGTSHQSTHARHDYLICPRLLHIHGLSATQHSSPYMTVQYSAHYNLLEYGQHSCRHHLYVIIVSHVRLHCSYFGMNKLGINVVDTHLKYHSLLPLLFLPYLIQSSQSLFLYTTNLGAWLKGKPNTIEIQ